MTHSLRGLHVHFDPSSGIAGDMAVAALVDAGVPAKVVSDAIAEMGVRGLKVGFEKRRRGAFVGKGFVVHAPHSHHDHHHEHHHEHRDYAEILRLLKRARLDPETKRLAGDIFERIAQAEAALHGVAIDRVSFHEVGAWDSIADVVGAAAAMAWLQPSSVSSTPPVLGSGQVRTAHGLMPVPAPATAAILGGVPALLEGEGELTTPTGAAILAALVGKFGPPPPLRIAAQGFGAGTREVADRANVLRVLLGEVLGRALPRLARLRARGWLAGGQLGRHESPIDRSSDGGSLCGGSGRCVDHFHSDEEGAAGLAGVGAGAAGWYGSNRAGILSPFHDIGRAACAHGTGRSVALFGQREDPLWRGVGQAGCRRRRLARRRAGV